MNEKILCVDDDPRILEGFKRQLKKKFSLDTAIGGEEALGQIRVNGPYAVVVSDMRMPGMNGVQFLSKVKESAPTTVRVMLTGNADTNTAIDAVNEGHIFRFLTKPCSTETFLKTIEASVKQFSLIMAERELLEKTLSRSVKVLVDILAIVNPVAFGRAMRLRNYVRHICKKLQLPGAWKFELAALLSQIGCVAIPPEILDKVFAGQNLGKEEQEIFDGHPYLGFDLIVKIPRLESIAEIIKNHCKPARESESNKDLKTRDTVTLGSQILNTVLEFDKHVTGGASYKSTSEFMLKQNKYNNLILSLLMEEQLYETDYKVVLIRVNKLDIGMIIDEDVRTKKGLLLVTHGHKVTYPLLAKLKNYWKQRMINDNLRVKVNNRELYEGLSVL